MKRFIKITTQLLKILFFLALFPIFLTAYYLSYDYLGYNVKSIPILGTGSMYPTFPKSKERDRVKRYQDIVGTYDFSPYPNGLMLFGKRYFNFHLKRGDIVIAENKSIYDYSKELHGTPSGVIKRIIALPGDSIEIRGEIVYLNNYPLLEPYTAVPHSTFGGKFLSECKKIILPKNKIFIMGDNRKGSGDSREFGWVDFNDIKAVIPLKKQKGKLDKNYRNTSQDLSDATKIKIDKQEYIYLLNKKRQETGVKTLKYQPQLEKSANIRGETIIKYDDFSFEATRSGITMKKALSTVGYSNIVYGEAPTQGYYEAEELIENQFEYPESKQFMLNTDYEEIGIAEVEGEINSCPTQVIVAHFAGYIPPDYNQEIVDSWKKALTNLKKIQPSWQKLKEYQEFYEKNKKEVDRINEIISLRINLIEPIVKKMEENIWLTDEETNYTYKDQDLINEENQLAERLNKQ